MRCAVLRASDCERHAGFLSQGSRWTRNWMRRWPRIWSWRGREHAARHAPEEARRQALVRFGGVQQAREQQRDARGLPWLDVLVQDLRFTLRTLRRDRGFHDRGGADSGSGHRGEHSGLQRGEHDPAAAAAVSGFAAAGADCAAAAEVRGSPAQPIRRMPIEEFQSGEPLVSKT